VAQLCCAVYKFDAQFTGTPRSGDGGIHYSTVVKTTAGRLVHWPWVVNTLGPICAVELLMARLKNFAPRDLCLWPR